MSAVAAQAPVATGVVVPLVPNHPAGGATGGPAQSNAATGAFVFHRGDHVELAEAARATLETTELTWDEGAFWRYCPLTGLWKTVPDEVVDMAVASFAGARLVTGREPVVKISKGAIDGARSILRSYLLARPGRREFRNAAAGVAFTNGFAMVTHATVVLEPHSPAHLARNGHPFDYVAGAPHPMLDQFFADIFADTLASDSKQRVDLIQEFTGTSLIGDAPKYQRCMVLHGDGGNGKSQVLEIATAVVPGSGVASLPPQKWAERFQISTLVGATLNVCNEIPDRDVTGGEIFKSVISGEPVPAERKYQPPFEFRPRAGHIFSANTLPGTVDQSHGYWRRFLVVPFTRDMEAAPAHKPDMGKAVIAAELPAILAWALEGAARVQRQGGYTVPAASVAAMTVWRNDADPVRRFISTVLTPDPNATTTAKVMYEAYKKWAFDHGFGSMSLAKFYRRLNTNGVRSTHTAIGSAYVGWALPVTWRYMW